MYIVMFSNISRKKEEVLWCRLLTFSGFVENLVTWRFIAGARIAIKFEQNVAVGDFYLKAK